jgi:hypothetical protein
MDTAWRIEPLKSLRATLGGTTGAAGGLVTAYLRTPKTSALLAYPASHSDCADPRGDHMELLSPGCSIQAARRSPSVSLSSLRRQLEPVVSYTPLVPRVGVNVADDPVVQLNSAASTAAVAQLESLMRLRR